ncbi:MAG: hypothetical protein ACI8T1_002948, partial [Verrucomicrobiales bacterium]
EVALENLDRHESTQIPTSRFHERWPNSSLTLSPRFS